MLVLSRKAGEVIRIGDGVTLTVLRVQGARVQVGVAAPPGMRILRCEVAEQPPFGSEPPMLPADGPAAAD